MLKNQLQAGAAQVSMFRLPTGLRSGSPLAARGGDVLGSVIHASSPSHGFVYCVIAITAVYALMLPVLLLVPRHLMAARDGVRDLEAEAEVAREVEAPAAV